MAEYRTVERSDGTYVEERRRGGAGRTLAIILLLALVVVGILFATGFWKADVKGGSLPDVEVSGGSLPNVDLESKKIVVGTKETAVDVPKVTTEKESVAVPVVGVKDN